MLTAIELKALLREQGLRLSKRLGQHHLVDAQVMWRFIERGQFAPSETVVEIGAGLGALTEALAQRVGRLIALEVDQRFCALLAARMAAAPHVEVRCQDALAFPWASLEGATVIGAIPYHITSPIIVCLCEARGAIHRAMMIVQLEVAQRLLASPGTKPYGRLSVLGQYGWQITRLFDVARGAFFPQPAVDSCCIQLSAREQPLVTVENEAFFFEVVKAAFSQRRKTLVNCLLHEQIIAVPRPYLESMLQPLGLPPNIRGEQLSLEQFAALAEALWRATGRKKMSIPRLKK